MNTSEHRKITRREWLGMSLRGAGTAGATLAFTPELFGALRRATPTAGELMQRAIPSTGEKVPVIGLGRGWAKSLDRESLKETTKTFFDNGGRIIDTVNGGPDMRELVGAIVSELGVQDKVFWSTGIIVQPPRQGGNVDPAAVKAEVESLFKLFKSQTVDLIQVMSHADVPSHVAALNEMKEEGRVRYIGVALLIPPSGDFQAKELANLESLMRNESIDFASFDYGVDQRWVEKKILPLAQERKIGVIANFPFNRGRLFKWASDRQLPEWAGEFDATSWAQFFIKYALSHPAVTWVRTSTTNPKHMLDNIGGGIGRLPDEAMRRRMAELVDAWPRPQ